ncbi:cytochrome P450 [Rhypophila decipiens]|uniref:Cytochrome P450 n=1 Tax=Rhypophila decipiens TaxID=261697 RepID=A0AAN6Y0T2_9PEZI|nr:cytochrome P450 [Rhypophila decipiens]
MALLDITTPTGILGAISPVWMILGLSAVYFISYITFNIFFHPLSSYPGPLLWRATQIPYTISFNAGDLPKKAHYYHELYQSDVIRLAPNRLSYINPDAVKEIKGHRKISQGENGKAPDFFWFARKSIIGAEREAHGRVRRALAHGFSARTMAAQEGIISGYVDLFIDRLKGIVERGDTTTTANGKKKIGKVNLVAWFNYATFDIIGDLAFGSPFGCLDKSETHAWVEAVFAGINKFAKLITVRMYVPWLTEFIVRIGTGNPAMVQAEFAAKRIKERLEITTTRPDFVDSLVRENADGQAKFTESEVVQTMRLVVLAGSETTATALSGVAYYLCRYPEVQRRLEEEIRGAFEDEKEIDMHKVSKLKYMLAVLDETLRMYPPAANSFPRICQPGGDVILGKHVPGGTKFDVFAWAMGHSTRYFTSPEEFIPERWLAEEPKFPNDRMDASLPFSVGPRDCIGKNLAYMEMRVILARLLWNFDMEFADPAEGEKWIDQKCFNLWVKPDLDFKLTLAQRE